MRGNRLATFLVRAAVLAETQREPAKAQPEVPKSFALAINSVDVTGFWKSLDYREVDEREVRSKQTQFFVNTSILGCKHVRDDSVVITATVRRSGKKKKKKDWRPWENVYLTVTEEWLSFTKNKANWLHTNASCQGRAKIG